MNAPLSPRSAELVRQMVESGRYHSADEVSADALLALDEREHLRSLVAIGDAEIGRGDVVLFTPELAAQVRQEAPAMYRRGEQPDPDVHP